MRFRIINLLSLVTIAGLVAALVVATRSKTAAISIQYYDTWDVQESVVAESTWADKSQPPKLSASHVYQIVDSIAARLNSNSTDREISNWRIIRLSLEELDIIGNDSWAYVVTLEGSKLLGWDNNRGGMASVENISLLVLMTGDVVYDTTNSTVQFEEIESRTGATVVLTQKTNENLADLSKAGSDDEADPFAPSTKKPTGQDSNPFGDN